MIDKVFSIGDFVITPFGVMLVIAFVAAYWQLRSGLLRLGAGNDDDASAVLFAAGLGGIAGGKIYYAALYHDWSALIARAGLVWYGGFLGGLLAVLWVMRRRRLMAWRTVDALAPALAVGYGLGRIGCFLVGDDYGVPTSLPWGVVFRKGLPPTTAGYLRDTFGVAVPGVDSNAWVAVHPTQLYETILALIIWRIGVVLLRRRPAPGITFLSILALLASERFTVEILRAKDDRFFGAFTLAQGISVVILIAALALLIGRRRARDEVSSAAGSARPGP